MGTVWLFVINILIACNMKKLIKFFSIVSDYRYKVLIVIRYDFVSNP